jgi:hypothetical protein
VAWNGSKRFQFDRQWQRDFGSLAQALEDRREHVAAGHQLREAGAIDAARHELALADEAQERIDALEHALRDLT